MPNTAVKVQDVAEAFVKYADGTLRFFGCLTNSGINQSVSSDDIRCGIGNKLKTRIFTQKDLEVTVETGLYSDHMIELQSGSEFQTGQSVNVWKNESGTAGAGGTVDITGTPVGDVVHVQDNKGVLYVATFATGTVTITSGVEGELYYISYEEATTTADILALGSSAFPKTVNLILHTIAYDPDTDEVLADIWWDITNASPDGNIDLSYAVASNTVTNATFRALDVAGSYGSYIVDAR